MAEKRANDLNLFTKDQDNYSIDASKKLKVGIIGTGWIAESHISEYLKMPDVELVGVADLIPGKAEKFLKKWNAPEGVRVYSSHKELIDNEQLDAVSVCTYNMTHAECTIYALEHGVNVLLEKPMCVTLDEAVEIRKAEKKSGKIVSVGFQPRYNPNMQMIKYIIESGELGKVYHIQIGGGRRRGIPTPFGTTFIEKETGGIGALGDIGCYALDMVLNGMGYPKPLTVTGFLSDYFGKAEDYKYKDVFGVDDFAAGFVRLEGGLTIDFYRRIHADLVVLLSDIEGLYTADPHTHPDARLIPVVEEITPEIERLAGGAGSALGTGGMLTKVVAAKRATSAGVDMIITNGARAEVLYDILDGKPVGTRFIGKKEVSQ